MHLEIIHEENKPIELVEVITFNKNEIIKEEI